MASSSRPTTRATAHVEALHSARSIADLEEEAAITLAVVQPKRREIIDAYGKTLQTGIDIYKHLEAKKMPERFAEVFAVLTQEARKARKLLHDEYAKRNVKLTDDLETIEFKNIQQVYDEWYNVTGWLTKREFYSAEVQAWNAQLAIYRELALKPEHEDGLLPFVTALLAKKPTELPVFPPFPQ